MRRPTLTEESAEEVRKKHYLCSVVKTTTVIFMDNILSSEGFILQIIAIGLCLLLFATEATYIIRRKLAISRQAKLCEEAETESPNDNATPLSVIVYADGDNSTHLEQTIPLIFEQDYADFEVIVVNADESEATGDILTKLETDYPSLRTTFIPDTNCNVSIRKLAIMLGIKAAKNEIVVFTDANCYPQSNQWLSKMVGNIDEYTEIVIGYTHPDYSDDTKPGHRYRLFDSLTFDSQYLAAACRNHAYRCDRSNIAFCKHLFYDNKGFHRTMNLKNGDDDLFFSEIAAFTDTAVELSAASILTKHVEAPKWQWATDKQHRIFTLAQLSPTPLKIASVLTFIHYLSLPVAAISLALSAYAAWTNSEEVQLIAAGIAAGIVVVLYLAETFIYIGMCRSMAKILHAPKLFLTTPLFRFIRPLINMHYKFEAKKAKNYTWE